MLPLRLFKKEIPLSNSFDRFTDLNRNVALVYFLALNLPHPQIIHQSHVCMAGMWPMKISHFLSEPSHVREHASKGHRPCDEGHRGRQEQELRRSSQALRTRGRVLPARHQVRGSIRKGQSLHQSQMCKVLVIQ